ncbi:MAG: YkgJ family cysteine cluster protein [Spirochaetaceae bacterium]|jgi:Fe-S-cluster containining protein|nr:YkgJ family cysteine cluster protein [Spirochaetaceae bacterium]
MNAEVSVTKFAERRDLLSYATYSIAQRVVPDTEGEGSPLAGVCRYLEQNSCSIYGVRPLICRVEAMYQTFFKTVMTEEQFIQANLTACQELAERFQDAEALQKIIATGIENR